MRKHRQQLFSFLTTFKGKTTHLSLKRKKTLREQILRQEKQPSEHYAHKGCFRCRVFY